MRKYFIVILVVLLIVTHCSADTFVNRTTGESFSGYALTIKRGSKTQVRVEGRTSQYLNLADYRITSNYLGRKNKVFIFSVTRPLELIVEAQAFEKAIIAAANQGPLFILIEIDSPGGRRDLSRRIASAITKLDNCATIAFVKSEKSGGAYSTAATIALACDKIYISPDAQIGAAIEQQMPDGDDRTKMTLYPPPQDLEPLIEWQLYSRAIAKLNGRDELIVRAMVDEQLELVEVEQEDRRLLINRAEKTAEQEIIRTLSEKGSLLTLTAAEAVEFGIADEIIESRRQLLLDLDAAKAAQARDTKVLYARRQYLRAKTKFDKILTTIESLRDRQSAITEQLDALEAKIDRFNEVVYRGGREIQYDRDVYWDIDNELWQEVLDQRDGLVVNLLDNLQDQAGNYRKAITMAGKHPDLSHIVGPLEQELERALTEYEVERSQPRWELPTFY